MFENYIINENTMYCEAIDTDIVIYEKKNKYVVHDRKMAQFINHSCLFYGSSYNGRKKGTKALINEEYKLPIIINEYKCLIAFPITSTRSKRAIWMIYNNIKEYHQISNTKVLVTFTNGVTDTFYTSYYKFHQQILKCSRLLVVYNARNQ